MTASSPTSDLFDGLAQLLAGAGLGLTYIPPDSDEFYAADATAIVDETMPDGPDRVLCLTLYTISDAPTLSDSTKGLQVRSRGLPGDSFDAKRLDDAVFNYLQNLTVDLAHEIRLVSAYRRSGAPLGRDASDRYERTSNYALQVHVPSLNRT